MQRNYSLAQDEARLFSQCLSAPAIVAGGGGGIDLAPLERKFSVSSEESLITGGSTDAELSSTPSSLADTSLISDEELAQLSVRQLNQRLQVSNSNSSATYSVIPVKLG